MILSHLVVAVPMSIYVRVLSSGKLVVAYVIMRDFTTISVVSSGGTCGLVAIEIQRKYLELETNQTVPVCLPPARHARLSESSPSFKFSRTN